MIYTKCYNKLAGCLIGKTRQNYVHMIYYDKSLELENFCSTFYTFVFSPQPKNLQQYHLQKSNTGQY